MLIPLHFSAGIIFMSTSTSGTDLAESVKRHGCIKKSTLYSFYNVSGHVGSISMGRSPKTDKVTHPIGFNKIWANLRSGPTRKCLRLAGSNQFLFSRLVDLGPTSYRFLLEISVPQPKDSYHHHTATPQQVFTLSDLSRSHNNKTDSVI